MKSNINQLDKYLTYDFQILLRKNMIIDSYQYLISCFHKLESASISLDALNNIFNTKLEKIDAELKERDHQLEIEGVYHYNPKEDTIDYFGIPLKRDYIYNKLYSEIYSGLHNFFDIFAQFINSSFFADSCLEPRQVSFKNIIKEFKKFPEYDIFFTQTFTPLIINPYFQYIEDINNISKHRFQIFSKSSQDLLSGGYTLSIPSFKKDGREHLEHELKQYTIDSLNSCIDLLSQTLDYLNSYLTNNTHQRVNSRIYDLTAKLQFSSKENYFSFKPEIFEVYVKLDTTTFLDNYRILFSKENNDYKTIENYNCPYTSIIVYDLNDNYLGMLNLDSREEDLNLKDLPVKFKKYNFTQTKDRLKLYEHIIDVKKPYFPLLINSILFYQ